MYYEPLYKTTVARTIENNIFNFNDKQIIDEFKKIKKCRDTIFSENKSEDKIEDKKDKTSVLKFFKTLGKKLKDIFITDKTIETTKTIETAQEKLIK